MDKVISCSGPLMGQVGSVRMQNTNLCCTIVCEGLTLSIYSYQHIKLTFCILMDCSFWFWYDKLGIVHCTFLGVSGYNLNIYCLRTLFYLNKQCRPDKMPNFAFIWVFTVCKSTHLEGSAILRVKGKACLYDQIISQSHIIEKPIA